MSLSSDVRILFIYDPIHGTPVADGLAQDYVSDIINNPSEHLIYTATSLVVDYFRLAVCQKKINPNELAIKFNEYDIFVNEKGRFNQVPAGFCDYQEEVLMQIL